MQVSATTASTTCWRCATGPERLALLAKRSGRTVDDVTELWNERAAIREYDGGKRRKEAEQFALDDVADVVLQDVSDPRATRPARDVGAREGSNP